MTDEKVVSFNPLHKKHLGESVGQAMLRQPVVSLKELRPFKGAGIYAIYYSGQFDAYEAIANRNQDDDPSAPIYVGKAEPKGKRKGGSLESDPGRALYNRLKQHRKSIEEAENLDVDDFCCRYLIVDDIWIPLGESLLIARFSPLWNQIIDGFGNHDPGKGRHAGERPRWDVLHPGRPWANRCKPRNETSHQIIKEVKEHLRNNPPPKHSSMITADA